MNTNLKITFMYESTKAVKILVSDKTHLLTEIHQNGDPIKEVGLNLSLPNRLTLELCNVDPGQSKISLKNLSLGGLELSNNILNQICTYTPSTTQDPIVVPTWWTDGKVVIDFFAKDWIQYHLLYGNKIIL